MCAVRALARWYALAKLRVVPLADSQAGHNPEQRFGARAQRPLKEQNDVYGGHASAREKFGTGTAAM